MTLILNFFAGGALIVLLSLFAATVVALVGDR